MFSWRVCSFIRRHLRVVSRSFASPPIFLRSCCPAHMKLRRWRAPASTGRSVVLLSSGSILTQVFVEAEQGECDALDVLREIIYDRQKEMSGWERLSQMWTRDNSEWSPEVEIIKTTGLVAGFIGLMFGGSMLAVRSGDNFVERNLSTRFETKSVANQKYFDRMFVGFMRGGFTVGGRMALYALAFQAVVLSLAVYNNDVKLSSYVFAGVLVGLLARINRGIVAMLAAAAVGCFLSLIAGGLMVAFLAVTGISFVDIRHNVFLREWKLQTARKEFIDKRLNEINESGET